jgi:hypothetical protein
MRPGISKEMLARAGVRQVGAEEAARLSKLAEPGLWRPYSALAGVAMAGTAKEVAL